MFLLNPTHPSLQSHKVDTLAYGQRQRSIVWFSP